MWADLLPVSNSIQFSGLHKAVAICKSAAYIFSFLFVSAFKKKIKIATHKRKHLLFPTFAKSTTLPVLKLGTTNFPFTSPLAIGQR